MPGSGAFTARTVASDPIDRKRAGHVAPIGTQEFDKMIQTTEDAISLAEAVQIAARFQESGDFRTAARVYHEILRQQPGNADLAYAAAACEFQLGNFTDAEKQFRAALDREPARAEYHLALGRTFKQQGKFSDAIACYRNALALFPERVDVLISLGIVLWRDHQAPEAVAVLDQALRLAPDSFEAAVNCANALVRLERHDEAIAMYRRAVASHADSADVHNNLGKALIATGQTQEGRACFERALELRPDHPEALFNVGDLLFFSDRVGEAEKYYAGAVASRPTFTEGHMALGRARFDAGRFQEALDCFDRMAAAAPASPAAHSWRGIVLREMQRPQEAVRAFEEATALSKQRDEGYALLGTTYRQLGDNRNAEEFANRALETNPQNPPALNLKGNLALHAGKVGEALAWFSKAAAADVDLPVYAQNALFAMNYVDGLDAEALSGAHRQWGQQQATRSIARPLPHRSAARRRLKVGLVSPDLISHSVAHFVAPLLRRFDRDSMEIYCYANNRKSDAVTESFRKLATGWRGIAGKNDESVAQLIRHDGIDVLIDLAGHTAENRLGVFSLAPAPIQATWLGYPTTTGLPAMQFRISDDVVDPTGEFGVNTESVLRLPHSYFCYMPANEAPPVASSPFVSRGYPTFGSFNNLAKMTPVTFRLWANVLDGVPASRLILKNASLADADVRNDIYGRLAQAGIDPQRVELKGFEVERTRHLMLYNEIDISLDTFPYNGATTTCESLWMGAPVVSLRGQTHASRMGASILTAAGQADLIATDEEEYGLICRRLAGDATSLAQRRAGLRATLESSPLMDHNAFVHDFEDLLRGEFERIAT
ncbi:MAG: tetratricopeptide repeat protein [Betaproteobacteria bacterium]